MAALSAQSDSVSTLFPSTRAPSGHLGTPGQKGTCCLLVTCVVAVAWYLTEAIAFECTVYHDGEAGM